MEHTPAKISHVVSLPWSAYEEAEVDLSTAGAPDVTARRLTLSLAHCILAVAQATWGGSFAHSLPGAATPQNWGSPAPQTGGPGWREQ